jgi:hypothetical protein
VQQNGSHSVEDVSQLEMVKLDQVCGWQLVDTDDGTMSKLTYQAIAFKLMVETERTLFSIAVSLAYFHSGLAMPFAAVSLGKLVMSRSP